MKIAMQIPQNKVQTYYMATKFVLSQNRDRLTRAISNRDFRPYIMKFVDDGTGVGIEALKKRICHDLDELWKSYNE